MWSKSDLTWHRITSRFWFHSTTNLLGLGMCHTASLCPSSLVRASALSAVTQLSEKVNEFLREISPMREVSFWHDFIARFLAPNSADGFVNCKPARRVRPNEINANIDNSRAFERRAKLPPPPPLPPKPKLFRVSCEEELTCLHILLMK